MVPIIATISIQQRVCTHSSIPRKPIMLMLIVESPQIVLGLSQIGLPTQGGTSYTHSWHLLMILSSLRHWRPPSKPWGYSNLGVSAALIFCSCFKKVGSRPPTTAKERTQSKVRSYSTEKAKSGTFTNPHPPKTIRIQYSPQSQQRHPQSPKDKYSGTGNVRHTSNMTHTTPSDDG